MHVIIVGGGVAGLSAGIALRRGGHKVTILEQSSLLHETGAAITITPNATKALRTWGFDPVVSKFVVIQKTMILDGGSLNPFMPKYYHNVEEDYGIPLYSSHRVDLHNQLRILATQQLGPGQPVDLQVRCKVVDYDAAQGKVVLADNRVLQADLVVAADGVHSLATPHVVGDQKIEAKDTGWSSMRWLVPTQELKADPETAALTEDSLQRFFVGTKNGGGIIWYPCRNNEVQNFAYLSQAFDSSDIGEDFRAGVDPGVLRRYAEEDFNPAMQAVVSKAKEVKFWKLIAREPLPSWHKGRLVVVGDAAHPMLPFQAQGGAQAIEDGAALGVLFDQLQTLEDIEARLQILEQIRRNRASSIQILSNASHPAPQSVRDAASKYLPGERRLENQEDVNHYVFSFDVIKECEVALAAQQ